MTQCPKTPLSQALRDICIGIQPETVQQCIETTLANYPGNNDTDRWQLKWRIAVRHTRQFGRSKLLSILVSKRYVASICRLQSSAAHCSLTEPVPSVSRPVFTEINSSAGGPALQKTLHYSVCIYCSLYRVALEMATGCTIRTKNNAQQQQTMTTTTTTTATTALQPPRNNKLQQ